MIESIVRYLSDEDSFRLIPKNFNGLYFLQKQYTSDKSSLFQHQEKYTEFKVTSRKPTEYELKLINFLNGEEVVFTDEELKDVELIYSSST